MFRRSALRKVLAKHTNAIPKNNQIKHVRSKNETNLLKNISAQAEKQQSNNDEAEVQRIEEIEKFNNKNLKLTTDDEDMDFHVIAADEKYTQPDYDNLDTFHRAVYPIMFLAQVFACMPVTGVWQPNPRRVRFSFISPQMFITLLFMATSSVLSLGMLKHLLIIGVSAKNFVGLVFFFCVQTSCLLFVVLARRWPRLIRFWTRTEFVFTQPPYETPKRNLAKRVQMSAIIIITLFCIEHALYLTSAVLTYNRKARICAPVYNTSAEISLFHYVEQNYDYVFQIVPFSGFMAFFVLIVNGTCTFIWNYMDLFIMMVSKGFSYRFEQITNRIKSLEHEEVQESTFVEIREHYVKLCELLDRVDDDLSNIILLSSINNLYFVCAQLLNIFNKLRWPINYIYFWYSLLYLIGRTAFVFLTAAAINDESVGALSVLRRVSNRTWCIEIERLIFQMSTQTVALSGKKFYFLTRRLLFGMAGTIVTYELVLLQFDEPNRVMGLGPLCA